MCVLREGGAEKREEETQADSVPSGKPDTGLIPGSPEHDLS